MSQKSKWEYLKAIYTRYRKASKHLRALILILNEFCQVCGYHRKYAIRLLIKGVKTALGSLAVDFRSLLPSG